MLHLFPPGLSVYLLLLIGSLSAHRLEIQGWRRHSHRRHHLFRRVGPISLSNTADLSYHADILLGGQTFRVLVDTGSSDLWVAGNIQQSNDTTLNASVFYAIGSINGPIRTAHLQLGDHHVENQAFIQVPASHKNHEGTGILGLGPSSGSFILSKIPGLSGAPPLDRLFAQSATPSYFTILLGRDKDAMSFSNGTITIGSILSEYNDVLSSPKLPVTLASESDNQHFEIQLDQDGIIGPDGNPISLGPGMLDREDGRVTAVVDCGFSLPQVPRKIAEAIYGRFIGAELTAVEGIGGVWVLPCETEVNVTFVFGGRKYPIHPLDMSLEPEIFHLSNVTNSKGAPVCIGSFQPFTYHRGSNVMYDIVLGMAFMRNVYTLFDYANFVTGANNTEKDPYIQLYSITDMSEAHLDFVQARLGGVDTTGNQELLDTPGKPTNGSLLVYCIAAPAVVVVVIGVIVVCAVRHNGIWRRAKNCEKVTSESSGIE